MTVIKPISDLRNKSNEISDLAKTSNEPIFITKNGEGDLVVMSVATYDRLMAQLELLSKLAESQKDFADGDRGRSSTDVMRDLEKRYEKR